MAILDLMHFHTDFRISLLIFEIGKKKKKKKKPAGILIGIALNLADQFGEYYYLNGINPVDS